MTKGEEEASSVRAESSEWTLMALAGDQRKNKPAQQCPQLTRDLQDAKPSIQAAPPWSLQTVARCGQDLHVGH